MRHPDVIVITAATVKSRAAHSHPSLTIGHESRPSSHTAMHSGGDDEVDHPGDASPGVVGELVRPDVARGIEILGQLVPVLVLGRHRRPGYGGGACTGQDARTLVAVSGSASGSVRVFAVAIMKLASPVQRGTTWTWR